MAEGQAQEFISRLRYFPSSIKNRILTPLVEVIEENPQGLKEIVEYYKGIQGPRLVTHIDTDGLVSAIMMYAINPRKYAEINYTDYSQINSGKFIFLATDDVVDLPQPGNLINGRLEEIKVNFWADHHETGLRGNYKGRYFFDASSNSCASLLYKKFLQENPDLKRFEKLIKETDIVDAALYTDLQEPYNLKNLAVKIRLMLTSPLRRKVAMGFTDSIIIDCANPKNDYKEVLNQPIFNALANETLAMYELYRKYIRKKISLKERVVIKFEDEREKGTGIKDRYYPFVLFPESLFLLDVTKKPFGSDYMISMSENPFIKRGCHPSQLVLGESMREIAVRYGINAKDAGGHKGIGTCSKLPKTSLDAMLKDCQKLLSNEVKRIG
jgi:hypothetical protein